MAQTGMQNTAQRTVGKADLRSKFAVAALDDRAAPGGGGSSSSKKAASSRSSGATHAVASLKLSATRLSAGSAASEREGERRQGRHG